MLSLVAWTSLATLSFIVTTWFAWSTFAQNPKHQASDVLQNRYPVSFSDTVSILRIAQSATSWLVSNAVSSSLELAMWSFATSRTGSRLLTLLSLSPTTGFLGVVKLVCSSTSSATTIACGCLRALLLVSCFVGGIVLFIDTSAEKSYYALSPLSVIAGTGPFNGSLVAPFLSAVKHRVHYQALALTASFIRDPIYSVPWESDASSCMDGMLPCESYILPGGTSLLWPPLNSSISPDRVLRLENSPAQRLDFAQGLSAGDDFFKPDDCKLYGEGKAALTFCLGASEVHRGALKAGVYTCRSVDAGSTCTAMRLHGSTWNVTTTFSMSTYLASSITGARNRTILAVSNVVAQEARHPIDAEALGQSMGWLLNYTAANLPPVSSVAHPFTFIPSSVFEADWHLQAYDTLQNMLGYSLWYFTENNEGNKDLAMDQRQGTAPTVAAQFHVDASLCQSFTRFVIQRRSLHLYVALHSALLAFCWAALARGLAIHARLPKASSFPAVDFGAKLRRAGDPDGWPLQHVGMMDDDKELKRKLQAEVVAGSQYK